jgi:translation initiation factor 4B
LAKRTVTQSETKEADASSGDAKASPFGAARPIDTQQREREIEEKREAALKQKKEADDKAKEEKAARDAEARAARGDRADKGQAEGGEATQTGDRPRGDRRPSRQNGAKQQPKENGEAARERPSFSILQRQDGEDAGEADAVDASANGNIIGDKETKPQEVVVPVDGSGAAETTAQDLEEDGWSTVAAKPKNKGRGGGRAIAS